MTRHHTLLLLPLLAAIVVAGCDDDSAFEDDDRPEKSTSRADDDDDDDDDVKAKADAAPPPDPGVVRLVADAKPACMTVDTDAAFWIERDGTIAALQTTDVPSTGAKPAHPPDGLRARVGAGPCALVRVGDALWLTSLEEGAVHRLTVKKNADRTVSFAGGHATFGGFQAPASIALDDTWVFVAEHDSGAIKRFARPVADDADAGAGPDAGSERDAGAPATETIAAEGTRAEDLRLDEGAVYWLSYRSQDGASGLRRVAKAGGAVTTLARAERALERIGGALYFLDGPRARTVPASGGLATEVLARDVDALATDGARLYLAAANTMTVLGPDGPRDLFVFASGAPTHKETRLFAQPRRLVWTTGEGIHTRAVTP